MRGLLQLLARHARALDALAAGQVHQVQLAGELTCAHLATWQAHGVVRSGAYGISEPWQPQPLGHPSTRKYHTHIRLVERYSVFIPTLHLRPVRSNSAAPVHRPAHLGLQVRAQLVEHLHDGALDSDGEDGVRAGRSAKAPAPRLHSWVAFYAMYMHTPSDPPSSLDLSPSVKRINTCMHAHASVDVLTVPVVQLCGRGGAVIHTLVEEVRQLLRAAHHPLSHTHHLQYRAASVCVVLRSFARGKLHIVQGCPLQAGPLPPARHDPPCRPGAPAASAPTGCHPCRPSPWRSHRARPPAPGRAGPHCTAPSHMPRSAPSSAPGEQVM